MTAETFKAHYLPLHPKLYRIAYAWVENKEEAEDILQELYFKLWKKREELNTIENPEAFCMTLIKHLCLDHLRSSQRRNQAEALTDAQALPDGYTPQELLEKEEQLRKVNELIDHLPEKHRLILKLRGIDDCSFEEIEQLTGLTAVNIRVLLSRARKTIREQFERLYDTKKAWI